MHGLDIHERLANYIVSVVLMVLSVLVDIRVLRVMDPSTFSFPSTSKFQELLLRQTQHLRKLREANVGSCCNLEGQIIRKSFHRSLTRARKCVLVAGHELTGE